MPENKSMDSERPEEFVMETSETKVNPSVERYRDNSEDIKKDYDLLLEFDNTIAKQLKHSMAELISKIKNEGRAVRDMLSGTTYFPVEKLTSSDRKIMTDSQEWIDHKDEFLNAIKKSGNYLGFEKYGSAYDNKNCLLILPDGRGLGYFSRGNFAKYTSDKKSVYPYTSDKLEVTFISKEEVLERLYSEKKSHNSEIQEYKKDIKKLELEINWVQETIGKIKKNASNS